MLDEITCLSDKPNYKFSAGLPNGSEYIFHIYYLPRQQYWMMDIQYNDFKCNGRRIIMTDDLFKDFANILPYAVAVINNKQQISPIGQNAFTQQGYQMFVMDR